MDVYAIIKTGGKQYRVAPGDIVKVEKLAAEPGAVVQIDDVYLLVNDDGVTTGNPLVPDARVVAEVVEAGRDDKIVVFKMKRRKGYRRTLGHRQHYTLLRISKIVLGDAVYASKADRTMPAVADADKTVPAPGSRPARARPAPRIEPASPAVAKAAPPADPPPPRRPPPTPAPAAPAAVAEPPDPGTITPPPVVENERPTQAPEPAAAAAERRPEARTPAPVAPVAGTMSAAPVPAPLPKAETTGARAHHGRRYWLAAVLAVLLLAITGLFFIGSRERTPQESTAPEAVPLASPAPEQIAPTETADPKLPRRDAELREPAAVSAPSVPLQPPD